MTAPVVALAWPARRADGLEVRVDLYADEGPHTVVAMLLQHGPLASTAWATAALRAALDRAVRSRRGEAR